ncbi:MAG: arsenite methyltransferase [Rhodospirillales bacterium]|nr:arsenite methyltransferase [Rhodospirillales bacterium]
MTPAEPAFRDADQIRDAVRASYGRVAEKGGKDGCCAPAAEASSCCAPAGAPTAEKKSARIGYSEDEMKAVPEGANLGLGCGNPQAIAAMKPGEVVLDLGAGAGFDAFLAARQVGPSGRVIGVDMTHEMLAKARANARKGGFGNVEFRLGEIENLPVADNTADVIISNCVINLSPDKARVFAEAFRALKPGGRLAVADVVRTAEFPADIAADPALRCGCVSGAALVGEIEGWLRAAGFESIAITPREESRAAIADWAPGRGVERYVVSADIGAVKPKRTCC